MGAALEDLRTPYDPEKRPVAEHPVYAYGHTLRALEAAGVPHLVGGGLALVPYGETRDTKDLDVFIPRRDAERAMNALTSAGFTTLETDHPWLRKAQMQDVFIDLILWSKGPIVLSAEEVARGVRTAIDAIPIRIFAPEDLLVRKIYLMRDDPRPHAASNAPGRGAHPVVAAFGRRPARGRQRWGVNAGNAGAVGIGGRYQTEGRIHMRTHVCPSALACGLVSALVLGLASPALAALGDVSVGGVWAFRLTRGVAGFTVEQRAVEVERRIAEVLSRAHYRETGIAVAVRRAGGDAVIMAEDVIIVTVTAEDAAATTVTPYELATQWAQRLATGLNQALPDPRVHVF